VDSSKPAQTTKAQYNTLIVNSKELPDQALYDMHPSHKHYLTENFDINFMKIECEENTHHEVQKPVHKATNHIHNKNQNSAHSCNEYSCTLSLTPEYISSQSSIQENFTTILV
jgi:hypothetical protein